MPKEYLMGTKHVQDIEKCIMGVDFAKPRSDMSVFTSARHAGKTSMFKEWMAKVMDRMVNPPIIYTPPNLSELAVKGSTTSRMEYIPDFIPSLRWQRKSRSSYAHLWNEVADYMVPKRKETKMSKRQRRALSRKHQWLREREMQGAFVVLRVDDYSTVPESRGQFYPSPSRPNVYTGFGGREHGDGNNKALWSTFESAQGAATWATEKFGHKYGVFKMVAFVEHVTVPVKVTTKGL